MQQQPFGYGAYEPPGFERGRPAVITWYRVYAVTMLVLYGGFLVLWLLMTPGGPAAAQDGPHAAPATLISLVVVGLVALAIGGFYAIAAMVPYKPWGWTVGLIAICLGLSSCMVLAAVPLLVFWMKPETKAAFGRL